MRDRHWRTSARLITQVYTGIFNQDNEGVYALVMSGLELHDAAATGDTDAIEEYLESGLYDVNLRDVEWNNRTALHWACAKGYVDCVRLLLENGASASASTDTGWTPAHCAAQTGKLTSLRALHVADGPIELQDIYGDNPRRVAEIYGNQDCVNFLLQAELEAVERKKTEELENEINNSEDSVADKTPVLP